MIKFKQDISLGVDDLDFAGCLINPRTFHFKKNEIVDVEITPMEDCKEYVDLKFKDGGLAMGVLKDCFIVLTEEDIKFYNEQNESEKEIEDYKTQKRISD